MAETPAESEVGIFKKFVANLTSRQQQLSPTFHTYIILGDRLIIVVDISSIQTTLRDRMPQTSQLGKIRIKNQLSERPTSSGSNTTITVDYHPN